MRCVGGEGVEGEVVNIAGADHSLAPTEQLACTQ